MSGQPTTVRLSLDAGQDASPEELEQLTDQLRSDLLVLDVERVDRGRAGPAPAGAKAINPFDVSVLLVTLAKSPALLTQVVEVVRGWLRRRRRLAISLEIGDAKLTIGGEVSQEERERLIDAWVDRALAIPPADPVTPASQPDDDERDEVTASAGADDGDAP